MDSACLCRCAFQCTRNFWQPFLATDVPIAHMHLIMFRVHIIFRVGHVTNIQINTFRLFDNYIMGEWRRTGSEGEDGRGGGAWGSFSRKLSNAQHFIYTLGKFVLGRCMFITRQQQNGKWGNLQLKRLTIYDIKRKKHQRFNKFENSLISLTQQQNFEAAFDKQQERVRERVNNSRTGIGPKAEAKKSVLK